MRILQVVHGFAPECRGGTESYVLEATLALRAAGHDVSVLSGSLEPKTPAQLVSGEHDGIPVTRLHRSGLFLDRWEKSYDPEAALLFERFLASSRPEVVHVHHWIRLTRNLVEIAAAQGVPAVVTLHDAMVSCPRVFRVREEALCHRPLSPESCEHCVPRGPTLEDAECRDEIEAYRRDFERELDLASALIVPSRAHQEFLSRELGRPAASFRVIPHGRLERDRPGPVGERSRGPAIRLGHWGHLEPYKGYHLILEALRLLTAAERRRFEVVSFGVASDPEYRRRLDALSEGIAVTERGRYTPPDLASVPFDLAVVPSLASESFSFVLDEAFELGVPALVPDQGALAERVARAGATFEAGSAAALAARLREVLADPGILDRWTAAIPALVPMRDHAEVLGRIYRGAVRHGRDPVPPDPARAAERLVRISRRLEDRTRALEQAKALAAGRTEELGRKEHDLGEFTRSIDEHRKALAGKDAAHARDLLRKDEEIAALAADLRRRDEVIAAFQKSVEEHKAEIARLQDAARRVQEDTRRAEDVWKRTVAEHQRSIALHAEAVAAREKDVSAARGRAEALASEIAAFERKVSSAQEESRSLAAEVEALQAAAASAAAARKRAEDEAAALDAARAEDQRQVEDWRRRARSTEAASAVLEATLAATRGSLEALRKDLDEARRRADAAEDDARRVDDLAARGAASLALPERPDGDRVARAADFVGAVLAQQETLGELRDWLGSMNGAGRAAEVLRRLDALPRKLRVLMVIHDFLPYHAAGSEVYTYQLAKALAARHDVELVFCENRPERPQYETRRGTYEGLPFTEIVHHAAFPDFRSTYVDRAMEQRFDAVLDRFRPDVVHVQHTKFFGVGILGRAARRGIPVVFTLHEYMLLCAREGQMLREDLARCDLPDTATCAECMGAKLVEPGPLAAGAGKVGRGLTKVLPGALKEVGTRIERRAAVRHSKEVAPARRAALIAEREATVREALTHVDLFLAPSEFLMRTFVASGFVPADRIVVSRYGQDLSRFRDAPKVRTGTLRVGYLGTIAAYKGVHVLVDALNRLSAQPVEGLIHGVTEFFPGFVRDLEARITNPKVRVLGRYDNKDVGRVLAGMDVLVVPSLWWENSPITIHEAFLAGVPVVASDQGGMKELVEDGGCGFTFRIGDAADLARVLMRFVADPTLLDRLKPRRESIRDIREDALCTEGRYRRLISEKAAAR
jgi:glycosyltransferase involved in cell wall biosynthesis